MLPVRPELMTPLSSGVLLTVDYYLARRQYVHCRGEVPLEKRSANFIH